MIRRQKKTAISQDYVESILRSMADMLVVLSEQGKIQTVNPATCQLLGYQEEELIGKDATLLFSEEEISVFKGPGLQELIREGSIRDKGARWKTKVGEKIPVSLSGAALRDQAGHLQGAVIIARDVTERKRAEESFRRLATVVMDSNDAITVQDLEGKIVAWNRGAEKMYGWNEREALKMNIRDTVLEEKKKEALEMVERLRKEETPSFETQRVTKDGRVLDVWLTVTKLVDSAGKPVAIATTERDITERKRAEKQIAAKNKELETLLYVTSHDLGEPLRSIQNFSQMVLNEQGGRLDEGGQDLLRRVVKGGARMRLLLNDILSVSQVRRIVPPAEEVKGEVIVREALDELEARIQETKAKVQVANDLPRLRADRTWATQALYNLVSNALKFAKPGEHPEVEIAAYRPGLGDPDGEGFVVSDRGLGVAPEHAERIFELFQRAVGHEVEGTGAGLAIVRAVAERHGGKAWVRPREGGGSEFIVTFGKRTSGGG